jgi:hypothetical protein
MSVTGILIAWIFGPPLYFGWRYFANKQPPVDGGFFIEE